MRRLVGIAASVLAVLGLGVGSGLAIAGIVEIEGTIRLRVLDECPTCPAVFVGYPTADSWVNAELPTTNNGTATTLSVKSLSPSKDHRTLVAFDLSSVPANAQIASANIVFLIAAQPPSPRTYNAYAITSTWDETSVNWNNQPSLASTPTDTKTIPDAAWMSWDVTSDVAAMVAGSATYHGWEIRDTIEGENVAYTAQFHSREHADHALHPRLEVVYTTP